MKWTGMRNLVRHRLFRKVSFVIMVRGIEQEDIIG